MNRNKETETIPVPRNRIFVLDSGTFVVQWEENRVQELMNGRYQNYSLERFGNAISDYELNQLKTSGIIASYDAELVYLLPSPTVTAPHAARSYYLHTTLHKTHMQAVENALITAQLHDRFSVRVQEIFVIIRGKAGMAFASFDDAEHAREILVEKLPDLLKDMVVAFVEINPTA